MAKEKKNGSRKKDGAVSAVASVKTKTIAMMILAMIVMAGVLSFVVIGNTRKHLVELNKNYLYDLTMAYGADI